MSVTSGFSYFLLDALCSWKNLRLSSTRSQQGSRSPRKFLKPNRTGPSARKNRSRSTATNAFRTYNVRADFVGVALRGHPIVDFLCKAFHHRRSEFHDMDMVRKERWLPRSECVLPRETR